MKTTENYSIPYPECAPPLVEDAAGPEALAALAFAADAALDLVYDQAANDYFNTDSVRMQAGLVTVTGQDYIPLFNSTSFNTGGMADTATGVVRIVEPGRYYVGSMSVSTTTGLTELRNRFLINGAPVSNFQTPGFYTPATGSTVVGYADAVLTFQEAATLSIQVRHSSPGSTSWNVLASLWATQLEHF